jgi:hypothetical protein
LLCSVSVVGRSSWSRDSRFLNIIFRDEFRIHTKAGEWQTTSVSNSRRK